MTVYPLLHSANSYNFDQHAWNKEFNQTLTSMVLHEDLLHTTVLKKNVFDPSAGEIAHNSDAIKKIFSIGHLWVQRGLSGAIIHWVTYKTVHRATLFEGTVLVASYKLEGNLPQVGKVFMPTMQLQTLLHNYLNWSLFQKKLELLPITCKVSEAANKKIVEMQKLYAVNDFAVVIIFGRRNKHTLSNPVEALSQAFIELPKRFLTDLAKQEIGISIVPAYRKVKNLSTQEKPLKISCERLHPSLLVRVKQETKIYPFTVNSQKKDSKGFELSLDWTGSQLNLISAYSNP